MKYIWLLTALCAVFGVFCGCKQTTSTKESNSPVHRVQVVMEEDSLYYLIGDTIRASGHVRVTDADGKGLEGIHVLLWSTGGVEQVAYEMRNHSDQTDGTGSLNFSFSSLPSFGQLSSIIRAQAGEVVGEDTVRFLSEGSEPGQLHIQLSKSRVCVAPPDYDSVIVTISLINAIHSPVYGVRPVLHASGGVLGSLPATNAQGIASTIWYSSATAVGHVVISVTHESLHDTAEIEVNAVSQIRVQLDTDTIRFLRGDTAKALGTATVFDAYAHPMPGIPVTLTLAQPVGHIELSDPASGSVTDANGELHFRYLATDVALPARNLLRAECLGHTSQWWFSLEPVSAASLDISAAVDTLQLWGETDDPIVVTLVDGSGRGIPDVLINLQSDAGLLPAMGRTDIDGRFAALWNLDTLCCPDTFSSSFQTCFVAAQVGHLTDTAYVVIYDNSGGD